MNKPLTFLLLSALLPLPLLAENPFLDEQRPMSDLTPDEIKTNEWAEEITLLPEYPLDEDLLEFQVDRPGTPFRYFIDTRSLVTDAADRVLRYTLIMESQRGARNVYHEGMRCSGRDFKTYAWGNPDGTFQPRIQPQWQKVTQTGVLKVRYDLMTHYLCKNGMTRKTDAIIQSLKSGQSSTTNMDSLF